jgi:serine/threonine-protein kinase RsbW
MAARIMPGSEQGGAVSSWAAPRDLRLSLPIEEATAGRVRRALRDYLAGQRVGVDVAEEVVLATDEACINAILHSNASGRLRIRAHVADGRLRIEVRDAGRGFAADSIDRTKPVGPLAAHGRGLFLITQLMDDVHIESHPGVGTVVEMLKKL